MTYTTFSPRRPPRENDVRDEVCFFLYSLCRYTQKRENYYAIVVVAKVYNVCDPIREVEKFQYLFHLLLARLFYTPIESRAKNEFVCSPHRLAKAKESQSHRIQRANSTAALLLMPQPACHSIYTAAAMKCLSLTHWVFQRMYEELMKLKRN